MKIGCSILTAICLFWLPLQAQTEFHTDITTQVGPGMTYRHIVAPTRLWNINVLEIDLTNPYVTMQTVKANDRLQGMEIVSSMAARHSYEGHEVVGAINGDFYDTSNGVPLNTQVINGEVLKNPNGWPTLGFDINNHPYIDPVTFAAKIMVGDLEYAVAGVNKDRSTDELILYNSFKGSSTGTNQYGYELSIAPVDPWIVNDTVRCVVEAIDTDGDMPISKGKAVLSGHGAAAVFLQNNLQIGDTVGVQLQLLPGLANLVQMVGGNNKILTDGVYSGGGDTAVHPRTFVGISADKKTLYIATVDGRVVGWYNGMSYRDLANFMLYLGASDAINLDGGGSTTFVLYGDVKNHPSDGQERHVANSMLCVSLAPAGTGTASIQVEPDNQRVFLKNGFWITVKGWDEYFHPSPINTEELSFNVDPNLGQVSQSGYFLAAGEPDSGYVYVTCQGLKDSVYIFIKGIKDIDISPRALTTDSIQTVQFHVNPTDVDNLHPEIALSDYHWNCLNPEVGVIDTTGKFKGIAEGQAKVVVQFRGKTDTALVTVEIGKDMVTLDTMDVAGNWTVSGELYDAQATTLTAVDTPKTTGKKALRLDYQFVRSSEGRSWVYLDTDEDIYGLPDTILLDIKSNGMKHIADVIISDDNDELFAASTGLFSTSATGYETYKIPLSKFNAIDAGSAFHFPIRMRGIHIKLMYTGVVGDTNSGTLYFDNLRLHYPTVTGIKSQTGKLIPREIQLYQNYPNPFNPNTKIRYKTQRNGMVLLEVYDLLGQRVCTLVNARQNAGVHTVNFEAGNLASGIYFYRLLADQHAILRKMILMR
ncbi:MAG: phosphodiester glycosidase family protein [Calditrichia bacterium]